MVLRSTPAIPSRLPNVCLSTCGETSANLAFRHAVVKAVLILLKGFPVRLRNTSPVFAVSPCKSAPLVCWCRVDHLNSIRDAHLIRFALHAHDCRQPLAQGLGAFASAPWVVLACSASDASTLHDMGSPGVTAPTCRAEVFRCPVGLIAINMSNHQSHSRTTPKTMFSCRPTFDGSLSEPSVGHFVCFLMPA
jgi:hypothetical protein